MGVRLPGRRLGRFGQQHVPDAGRLGGAEHRQPLEQAAVRDQVRLGADPVLRPRDDGIADPLRPRPPRARREGRAVPDARRACVPGCRRGQGRLDRRRLHDVEPVPVRGFAHARVRDGRLDHAAVGGRRGAAAQGRQLHPQLGQGDRRRVRRHGHAVRVGRRGPGAQGLVGDLPGVAAPRLGDVGR